VCVGIELDKMQMDKVQIRDIFEQWGCIGQIVEARYDKRELVVRLLNIKPSKN
jgi:hypothetical protein